MIFFYIGFVIDNIFRDEEIWKTKIESQVSTFFMKSILQEIIDSKLDRHFP